MVGVSVKAAIIINPTAGRRVAAGGASPRGVVDARDALRGTRPIHRCAIRRGPATLTNLRARASPTAPVSVVAWGGDGTVNEVASAILYGRAVLGIVPVGSGNGLASRTRRFPPILTTALARWRVQGRRTRRLTWAR